MTMGRTVLVSVVVELDLRSPEHVPDRVERGSGFVSSTTKPKSIQHRPALSET